MLLDPATASHHLGVGTEQHVGGPVLDVQAHTDKLGPALQPAPGPALEPRQVGMAAHQCDQQLTAVLAQAQRQVAQPAFRLQMAIHRPGGALQIVLERGDQLVESGIEHRAVVHVHQRVAAAAVIPGPQRSIGPPLQGQDGPVAVAQAVCCTEGGCHQLLGVRQLGDALQGLHHLAPLPLALGLQLQVLQAAATAAVRQHTGRAAALG